MNKEPDPNKVHHQPEYVILEAEENPYSQKEQEDPFAQLKGLGTKKFPLSMRITVFVVLLFLILLLIFPIFYLILTAGLSTITFFQSSAFNAHFKKAWNIFLNTLVVILGFAIAVFSPPFGFGIIMLYTLMHKNSFGNVYIKQFFR